MVACILPKKSRPKKGGSSEPPRTSPAYGPVWKTLCPDVQIMRPCSDVCAHCEKLREKIKQSKTEEETAESVKLFREHLEAASDERDYYCDVISAVAEELEESHTPQTCHLTFDFVQQLGVPYHFRQVGPLYFKSRFKIQLFGVCDEPHKQQVNYLFHKNQTICADGKLAHGLDCVILLLHHHLQTHAHGEPHLHMHADNCVGQNKNQYVIAYLAWRVLVGLNSTIHLLFMHVGHMRCSVDAYFGLLKKKICENDIDTLADAVEAVQGSCKANIVNTMGWQWRSWQKFLGEHFVAVKGIRKIQHFMVSNDEPGVITMQKICFGKELQQSLLKSSVQPESFKADDLPAILVPGGISDARMKYLDHDIAPYPSKGKTPTWQ